MSFLFLLRLEFEDVEMGGPEMGACQNDTMMVRKCERNICNIIMMVRRYKGNIYNQTMNQWDHFKIPESQVSGMDAVSVKVVPSTLCGTLTGQHSEQHLVQFLTK